MFPETRWTLLATATLNGSAPGREALSGLYLTYREPVRRFILSKGWAEDAEDLTQAFFLYAMEHRVLQQASPERGRFRSYLLGVLNHFLLMERDRRLTQKRGGQQVHVPLENAESLSAGSEPPEITFDRQWAQAAMSAALAQVAAECAARRGEAGFRIIGRFLGAAATGPDSSYESAARELGMTAGALRVDVHMWRRRLREALRHEVLRTVSDPAQADEEWSYLRGLLSAA